MHKKNDLEELAQRARQLVRREDIELDPDKLSKAEISHILHEFRVYQLELELQNDELRETQYELELVRDQYASLYEFAPVGYVILNQEGIIEQANLTAAKMLDRQRDDLVGQLFARFVARSEQERFYFHHKTVFETRQRQSDAIELVRPADERFFAHLESIAVETEGVIRCRTVVTDITEQQLRLLAEALSMTALSLTSTLELNEVLDRILVSVGAVIPHDLACITLFKNNNLQVFCTQGEDASLWEAHLQTLQPGFQEISIFQEMLTADKPVLIAEASREDRFLFDPQRQQAYLGTPLQIKDQTLGILHLSSETSHFFKNEHLRYIQIFAAQAAVAVYNARLYEEAQELAAVRERHRIARDLHDSVNQMLFTSSILAQTLAVLVKRNPEATVERLERLYLVNRGAQAEMRILLLELRPDHLTQNTLPQLLQYLVDALQGRLTIQTHTALQAKAPIPHHVKIAFYRIAQEALNNIVKHAHATKLEVTLKGNGSLAMMIHDNGQGFQAADIQAGMGMANMRERVTQIGADLVIESTPNQGTTIKVSWKRKP